MKRGIFPLFIFSLLLSACGAAPSVWGTYATPTSNPISILPEATVETAPVLPTPISEPIPVTPTLMSISTPTEIPITSVPTQKPATETTSLATSDVPPVLYYSQSGDTLDAVAAHFGVDPSEITSSKNFSKTGLIDPGTLLVIPERLTEYGPNIQIMPDSEIVFSVSAADFDIESYIKGAGGELANYREFLGSAGWTTGVQAIERVSMENSINPRLLLALLDHEGNWVTGSPTGLFYEKYPMGFDREFKEGLFIQTVIAVNELYIGYYGWRSGTLTELTFPDGETLRIAPDLNAGTVAIQYFFSKLYNRTKWQSIIDPNVGFPAFYTQQFGDPWQRAQNAGPIFPPGLRQPTMVLPFEPNREWAFTGGPHGAWEREGPLAALDFAPATDKPGCTKSEKWLVASAPGLVVRTGAGLVVLDLDGDGYEETGWNLIYLHIGAKDRVQLGEWVEANDRMGYPSCEGGISTGTHLHFVRKYNGEWVPADGPLPFVLSGYEVQGSQTPYEGTLTKDDKVITAHPAGIASTTIIRQPEE